MARAEPPPASEAKPETVPTPHPKGGSGPAAASGATSQQPTTVAETEQEKNWKEVLQAERQEILKRRVAAELLKKKEGEELNAETDLPKQLTGLAFSGGGIRAACLAFGFTQGLVRNQIASRKDDGDGSQKTPQRREPGDNAGDYFSWFDYLSTVSGGGYTGSMLTALATIGAQDAEQDCGMHRANARAKALNELDPGVNEIEMPDDPSAPRPNEDNRDGNEHRPPPGKRLPLWRVFRYRGRKIGNMPSFISRHLVNTVIFNIPLVSALVLVTCGLAFLWRLLDEMPITDYFWWASNHNTKEATRPFLVPVALGYIWVLIAVARPKNNRTGTILALLAYALLPLLYFGLPFLIVLTLALLATWLLQTIYAGKEEGELRTEAVWPALLLLLVASWLVAIAHPSLRAVSSSIWIALGLLFLLSVGTILQRAQRRSLALFAALSSYAAIATCLLLGYSWPQLAIPRFSGALQFWLPCGAFWAACVVLSFWVGRRNRELERVSHRPALIAACTIFFCGLLASVAVFFATPNMNVSVESKPEELFRQSYMSYIWPLISALLLPLLRPQALFRSGEKGSPPTQRWFFNAVSAALLGGIPFLLVYIFAQHNLSGHASKYNREWKKHDLEFAKLSEIETTFGDLWPPLRGLHQTMKLDGDTPCRRHFPFNRNLLAIPLYSPSDVHAENLWWRNSSADADWRDWSSERAAEEARENLALEMGVAIRRRLFWLLLLGSQPKSVNQRLCANLRRYAEKDPAKASDMDGYRIHLAKMALGVLKLSAEEVKSDNGKELVKDQLSKVLGLQFPPAATGGYVQQGMCIPFATALWVYLYAPTLDIEKTNVLFHVAFAELMSPLGFVRRGIVVNEDQKLRLIIMAISLLVFALAYNAVNINLTSLQNYYRRQLEEAFLSLPVKRGEESSEFRPADAVPVKLTELNSTALGFPYQLLQGITWYCDQKQEPARINLPFTFSKLWCGGPEIGFVSSWDYESRFPDDRQQGTLQLTDKLTLADAMSISGAAVSPYQTEGNLLLLAVMTVTNFRTGQWLPNPAKQQKPRVGGFLRRWVPNSLISPRQSPPTFNPTLKNARKSFVEDKWFWLRKNTDKCNMIFVADGGYVENLGVKALLDRRCQFIVGLDAGADPNGEFENLVNLLRQARDAGISINLNENLTRLAAENTAWYELIQKRFDGSKKVIGPSAKCFDPVLPARLLEEQYGSLPCPYSEEESSDKLEWKQFSASHFIIFDVQYGRTNSEKRPDTGIFIYVRSSLTGDEPSRILLAMRDMAPFPNHPTSEQLYDPELVEVYRELGLHLADRLCFFLNELAMSSAEMNELQTAICKTNLANDKNGRSPVTQWFDDAAKLLRDPNRTGLCVFWRLG